MPPPPELLRTPDDRFAGLPDWPWAPRYLDDLPGFEGIRVHRVDEAGRAGAPTALLLHGNPAWGYLYRRMIPVFRAAGLRVVVPDLEAYERFVMDFTKIQGIAQIRSSFALRPVKQGAALPLAPHVPLHR